MAKQRKPKSVLALIMKISIVFSVLFLLSAGGMYVYGMSLPAEHQASGSLMIDAPVGDVFELENSPQGYPEWRENVEDVRHFQDHGEGVVTWTEVWRDGNQFEFTVIEYVKDERLKVKIDDANDYFEGAWTYEFKGDGDKTTVTVTENGAIPNPFIRAMYKLSADPATALTTHLDELETHFANDGS